MSNKSSSAGGGIGLCGVVFCIFLTLKLLSVAPVAAWSWWWVTAPLWGPLALVLGIIAVVAIIAAVSR